MLHAIALQVLALTMEKVAIVWYSKCQRECSYYRPFLGLGKSKIRVIIEHFLY